MYVWMDVYKFVGSIDYFLSYLSGPCIIILTPWGQRMANRYR